MLSSVFSREYFICLVADALNLLFRASHTKSQRSLVTRHQLSCEKVNLHNTLVTSAWDTCDIFSSFESVLCPVPGEKALGMRLLRDVTCLIVTTIQGNFGAVRLMHQSIPPAPSRPPPPGNRRAFASLVSPGGGALANLARPGGRASGQPRGHPRAFDTHVVNFKTWSTWRISEIKISSLWRIGLSSKG